MSDGGAYFPFRSILLVLTHDYTNTNNFILDIKYVTISVTIIYINKHDIRLTPGNRYKDHHMCLRTDGQ